MKKVFAEPIGARGRQRSRVAAGILLCLICAVPGCSSLRFEDEPCIQDPHQAVSVLRGDVPVVLAVPHDGTRKLCGVTVRINSSGSSDFRTDRDLYTADFAVRLRNEILHRTGTSVFIVQSLAAREYMDPNRPSRRAAEHTSALKAWEEYHARIDEALGMTPDESGKSSSSPVTGRKSEGGPVREGRRILIEIHSQAAYPADFHADPPHVSLREALSTLDKSGYGVYRLSKSVRVDSAEHGCFIGPCDQALDEKVPERYLDGYTARSHRGNGVESMQLEIHARLLRSVDRRAKTARDLARAFLIILR